MKSKNIFTLFIGLGIGTSAYANVEGDSLGLPGDGLDLYGALELFKKSDSPEAFEKAINEKGNEINNLDLNGDGEVDYIRVIDNAKEDVHAFVLQVPVSETELQDVAVIELEKDGSESATVQIIGDEDIYGKDYIVEPVDAATKTNLLTPGAGIIVNVWMWPVVRFVYAPRYVLWASPYKWRQYPGWYKPWKPVAWHVHRNAVVRYHAHHQRVHVHRVIRAHKVYHGRRTTSVIVHKRHKAAHERRHQRMHNGPKKDHQQGGGRHGNGKAGGRRR